MDRIGLLVLVLFALPAGFCGPRAEGGDEDETASLRARLAALERVEWKRLEFHLRTASEGPPPALLPAVRLERTSEIRTFLAHLEEAPLRRVLVLGSPSPAVARIVLTPLAGNGFVLDVTERAFRVLGDEAGASAHVFQSPALLRWIEDRLEVPHHDLREGQDPPLATLRAAFLEDTRRLTREAQGEDLKSPGHVSGLPAVRNGGFEEELIEQGVARGTPVGWDRVDGLTTFWRNDPFPRPDGTEGHKALVMDTDVLKSEWVKRKEEMAEDRYSEAWPKTYVEESQQYATVGATYGVSCYSAPIAVEKGRAYRVTVHFRAAAPTGGIAKLWVRGYGKLEVRGKTEWRRIYESLHTLRTDDPTWHEYANVFHPTKNTPRVERMRVMLYGYWPRGEYRWDDVRVEPISDAEYRHAKATERSDVK